ncbi:MAG: hypothetical protein AAF850_07370 [Pseudomonadota bacterium]
MRSFGFSDEQVTRIVAALIAQELRDSGRRHFDPLSASTWNAETVLGEGGVELGAEALKRCVARVARFFGQDARDLQGGALSKIGDLSSLTAAAARAKLVTMSFTPAGQPDDAAGCSHRADDVFLDAAAAANLIYGRRRLVSLVSPHSYFGFVLTVVTPNLQRIETFDARPLDPQELQNALQFGDALLATPTLWRYLLQEGLSAPDNAMGIFFGEPMPPTTSAEMRQAGFAAQRELYGSTENGLIGWRDSPTDPFSLFDHWAREGDAMVRAAASGESLVTEPMDILSWSAERQFMLAGRRDGAVQIGAVNVFPERIAALLQEHPSVDACMIRIRPYQNGANRVIAHVKLSAGLDPIESTMRDIDHWCRDHLRNLERPSVFHFEETLDGLDAAYD